MCKQPDLLQISNTTEEMSSAFSLYSAQDQTSLDKFFSPLGHESVAPECESRHLLYGLPDFSLKESCSLLFVKSDRMLSWNRCSISWIHHGCLLSRLFTKFHHYHSQFSNFSRFQYLFCSCGTWCFFSAAQARISTILFSQILTFHCWREHFILLYHLSFQIFLFP
jgi:hypothetical protein